MACEWLFQMSHWLVEYPFRDWFQNAADFEFVDSRNKSIEPACDHLENRMHETHDLRLISLTKYVEDLSRLFIERTPTARNNKRYNSNYVLFIPSGESIFPLSTPLRR